MKVGIVGTSFVSDWFMEGVQGNDDLEVIGVCSGHFENAVRFQKTYGLEKVYATYTDMLEDERIDVVYIATPNSMHVRMALDAISYRKDVILEKPMASSGQMADNVFSMANTMNCYVHDAIVPLYTKNFQVLKDNLKRVGKIRRVVINFSKYSSRYDAYLNGEKPAIFDLKYETGCWMDLGVYCVADCVGLFGEPLDVYASSSFLESGVDCTSQAILKYEGFDAVLLCSKVNDSCIVSEIQGEEGTLQFVQPALMEEVIFIDRKTKKKEVLARNEGNHFGEQFVDFVEAKKEGLKESQRVSHKLSLSIMKTLERCRKSSGVFYRGE